MTKAELFVRLSSLKGKDRVSEYELLSAIKDDESCSKSLRVGVLKLMLKEAKKLERRTK